MLVIERAFEHDDAHDYEQVHEKAGENTTSSPGPSTCPPRSQALAWERTALEALPLTLSRVRQAKNCHGYAWRTAFAYTQWTTRRQA